MPTLGQGLGMPEPQRPGLSSMGRHPNDGQKALSVLKMISDRL
jgi:hypothetical protein